jgi:nucleotide-binding universal stress UspA family protein
MKVKSSKDTGRVVLEFNPRAEPHIVTALFDTLENLPRVKFKKILATIDYSELSLEGVDYAIAFAAELGATLSLVNVVQPSVTLGGTESVVIARSDEEIVKLEKRHLAKLSKKLAKNGRIVPYTLYGKPYREIVTLARERAFDLIVTATHGNTGLRRVLLGSTAEWVVRHAPCPVLTVPALLADRKSGKRWVMGLNKILVPIDFSETSTKALPYAVALAQQFKAEVTLIHVTELPPALGGYDYMPSPELESRMKQSAEELLARVEREAFPDEIYTNAIVRSGTPFHEITKAASRLEADLIILTTHGRTGLKHALLGSNAERIVRHSSCPVLVVRDKESEKK